MKVALCFWNGWRERTKISLYQRSKTKSYKKCVNQFYDIVGSIKNANFYSIIIDEISDASNKEQTVFRVFWVDGNLFTQEEFLGLHKMKKTDAIGMSNLIKDIVLRLGFYSKKKKIAEPLIWRLYSNDGDKKVIDTLIKDDVQPLALSTYCHGHSLHLTRRD